MKCEVRVFVYAARSRAPQGARGLKYPLRWAGCSPIGRAPQGARGLKSGGRGWGAAQQRRAPQGARGLKSNRLIPRESWRRSRPARGAWIEIEKVRSARRAVEGRAPQGARGLKSRREPLPDHPDGRAPQGARGLKFQDGAQLREDVPVAPRKGRVD